MPMNKGNITINEALKLAQTHAKRGDLDTAAQFYSMVIASDPSNKKAKKGLRGLQSGSGKEKPSVPSLEQKEHVNALYASGRVVDALTAASNLAQSFPHSAFAFNVMADCQLALSQWKNAADNYRRGLRIQPENAIAHNNRGVALARLGQSRAALDDLKAAVRINPAYAEAWTNLGNALRELGEHESALEHYKRAVALQPDNAAALSNAGNASADLGDFPSAIDYYEAALTIHPDYPDALYNLGNTYRQIENLEKAEAYFRRSLTLDPKKATAHNNLGNTLLELGRSDQAVASYDEALRIEPDYINAHFNLSNALLLNGDYRRGWDEYEWRLRKPEIAPQVPVGIPRWQGQFDHSGELILVAEQGMGDTVQFLRYGSLLKKRLPRVSLAAPDRLHGLVKLAGIYDHLYSLPLDADKVSTAAQWIPLLSVPRLLGVSLEDPLVSSPYLHSDDSLDSLWRQRLRRDGELLVGITWQGNPSAEVENRRGRSLILEMFSPLAKIPGVRLLSLQKGEGSEQLEGCSFREAFSDQQECVTEVMDFEQTASIMRCCDLIISCDTLTVHLAGALGCPTWILLQSAPDWRWGRERSDTPWYPSGRLFRQNTRGNWDEVISRVATLLREWH